MYIGFLFVVVVVVFWGGGLFCGDICLAAFYWGKTDQDILKLCSLLDLDILRQFSANINRRNFTHTFD